MITVMSFKEGGKWHVHGINIDFYAEGDSHQEALLHFWAGLAMTFWKTQTEKGNVSELMKPPPAHVTRYLEGIAGRSLAGVNLQGETIQ